MTYTYINQINPSPRVKQENQKRFIITCCPFKEIDRKQTPSTKIAKMGDCNDSSSHRDSSLSSDSDAEYQVESGKTREPQTRKTSKQLRYYYRKTAGRTKRTYTPFADQENPSKQLKCYHAMKECESALLFQLNMIFPLRLMILATTRSRTTKTTVCLMTYKQMQTNSI